MIIWLSFLYNNSVFENALYWYHKNTLRSFYGMLPPVPIKSRVGRNYEIPIHLSIIPLSHFWLIFVTSVSPPPLNHTQGIPTTPWKCFIIGNHNLFISVYIVYVSWIANTGLLDITPSMDNSYAYFVLKIPTPNII